jgi:hypothetical protein
MVAIVQAGAIRTQTYLTPLWDLDTVAPRNLPRIHTPSYLASMVRANIPYDHLGSGPAAPHVCKR